MGWDQICGLTGWVGVVRCKNEAINIEVGWDTVEDERLGVVWVGGGWREQGDSRQLSLTFPVTTPFLSVVKF